MNSQDHKQHPSTFWFGFALGSVALGTAAFLFGTKRGRSTLHKMLELSENLEENLINLAQEVEEVIEEVVPQNQTNHTQKSLSHKTNGSSLSGILHKMHIFSQPKSEKKVFTRDTK